MPVRYLKNNEINFSRWDRCMKNSINGSVYGYSWYLNAVAGQWDALMENDYETVMPLTFSVRYGKYILYQPIFTYYLGIFSTKITDSKLVSRFLEQLSQRFSYSDMVLNKFNKLDSIPFKVSLKPSYELDLIPGYEKLKGKFLPDTQHNIKLANGNKIQIIPNINPKSFLLFYLTVHPFIDENRLNILQVIINTGLKYKMADIYGAYNKEKKLIAACFFIWSHKKVILLMQAVTREGYRSGSIYLLIDQFIRNQCEKNITLSFESSTHSLDIEIFNDFAAQACNHAILRMNDLPWYVDFLKLINYDKYIR